MSFLSIECAQSYAGYHLFRVQREIRLEYPAEVSRFRLKKLLDTAAFVFSERKDLATILVVSYKPGKVGEFSLGGILCQRFDIVRKIVISVQLPCQSTS